MVVLVFSPADRSISVAQSPDAIEQCFTTLVWQRSATWVLEGDIRACFDEISHDWLLANIPMETDILRKWLKAGYMEKEVFHPTEAGTPQVS